MAVSVRNSYNSFYDHILTPYSLDCQNDLSKSITKLNPNSKLFVLREAPQSLFPKLFKAWRVTHLVFEKDTDAYARDRDAVVIQAARDAGVQVVVRPGRTLWDSDGVVEKHGGKPTMSMAQLLDAGKKVGPIPRPISAPERLPDPGEMPVDFSRELPETRPDFNEERRTEEDTAYKHIAGPNGDFAIETMEELGFPSAMTPHRGGETLALERLDRILADKRYTATFEKPKTSPAEFEPQATTLLSPFLHFGALSVRLFYWGVQDVVDTFGKGASSPPESLTGQLLFRDMYFAAQAALGHKFSQTAGNPECRFIPWHLPSETDPETGIVTGEHRVDSEQAAEWFRRWKHGVTGFPWIDALMRQLKREGWIHHLGRHSVACFLTRGGCYVDWERGAEVFEEWLLDHEPACNAGNWQWLSCTAFFSQYFRCYSPVSFGKKWDKQGSFVRRWVPELKGLDAKYIYEPWKAPLADQKRAGVRIVGDGVGEVEEGTYPKPMFDFDERRTVCLRAMKSAYGVGLRGSDACVLDGTWREKFPEEDGAEMMEDVASHDEEHADRGDDRGAGKEEKKDVKEKRNGSAATKRATSNGASGSSKKQKTLFEMQAKRQSRKQ